MSTHRKLKIGLFYKFLKSSHRLFTALLIASLSFPALADDRSARDLADAFLADQMSARRMSAYLLEAKFDEQYFTELQSAVMRIATAEGINGAKKILKLQELEKTVLEDIEKHNIAGSELATPVGMFAGGALGVFLATHGYSAHGDAINQMFESVFLLFGAAISGTLGAFGGAIAGAAITVPWSPRYSSERAKVPFAKACSRLLNGAE
jgi:hypothetical protein